LASLKFGVKLRICPDFNVNTIPIQKKVKAETNSIPIQKKVKAEIKWIGWGNNIIKKTKY